MSEKKIHIIFNPASAGGKTSDNKSRIISELKNQLRNGFDFSETQTKTDATRITREAIEAGFRIIVAVGGDGTVNQVVNGFFENGTIKDQFIKLGVISSGTGQGFAQSIGLPKNLTAQIKVIKNGITKSTDVGKIRFEKNGIIKYFVNEFQFGIGGTLNKTISPLTKKVLGKYAFGFEAVKTLFSYKANNFQMVINGKVITESVIGVIISNGAFTGGGMRLTPNALLNDAFFDVLLIKNMSLFKRISSFSRIYSGDHITLNGFQLFKTKKVEFRYNNNQAVEADGELIFDKCVSAEIIPSALRVISNK